MCVSVVLGAFCIPLAATAGDVAKGEALASQGYCYTCHGDKGVAPSRNAPSLAGQSASYTAKMLKAYQDGLHIDNKSLGMQAVVKPMSDQDMADLAAFYAAQSLPAAAAKGTPPASAMSCIGCHNAAGTPGMGGMAPGLGGMSAGYIERQVLAYKSGKRPGGMMTGMLGALNEAKIHEIAEFYGSD